MKTKFPLSVPYIIGNEAAERFSYYGMKAILPIFLIDYYFNPTNDSSLVETANAQSMEVVHFFVFLAYLMPVVGALMADWFFGKYKVILYVSIVYTFGHLCLSLFEDWYTGFMLGLILIAIGAGGIKSNVSANVGDQFNESNKHLLPSIYSWFYFSINAGSVISTISIPWIYHEYGPSWAFGIPGIFMALATLIYFMGNKKFVKVPPSGINKNNFVFINIYALYCLLKNVFSNQKVKVWQKATEKFSEKGVDGVQAVWKVLAVFAFIPCFWALWDQCQSSWVLQAKEMDRTIDLFFFKLEPLAAQIHSVNPFLILIFIPILNLVYPAVEKLGIKVTPLRKIGFGLFLTSLSFVLIALAQEIIDAGVSASVWWQLAAFVVLTLGEVMVSVTGLEYAYTQAPMSMKSTMTAFWLLTVSVGNLFVSLLNANIAEKGFFAQLGGASYFWFFAILMFVIFILFAMISGKIKERSYMI